MTIENFKRNNLDAGLSPVLFLPHGGGPLPLLGDKSHSEMISFLRAITPQLGTPSAIVLISAHWEEEVVTITSGSSPSLIYDYTGFPEEAYKIKYPAPGAPKLAKKIAELLDNKKIASRLDDQRGFDHGLFVPLKLLFPEAKIPCVQVSLLKSLDPTAHIQIGQALAALRHENVLIIGSGFSFHNLGAFFSKTRGELDPQNEAFESWLIETCTHQGLTEDERRLKLSAWQQAPFAHYCHPREEHLLPLHVCYGFAQTAATLVFDGKILGKKTSAYFW